MSEESSQDRDLFELVHSFVTASLQGELLDGEVEDFERLLQDNADARKIYTCYIETTLRMPRMLATLAAEAGQKEQGAGSGEKMEIRSPVLGFLGDLGRQGWGYVSEHTWQFTAAAVVLIAGIALFWNSMSVPRQQNGHLAALPSEISSPKAAKSSSLPLAGKGPSDTPGRTHIPLADAAGLRHITPPKAVEFPQGLVAIVTGDYNATWNKAFGAAKLGGGLKVGQELRLDAGLAELTFKLGTRVIVEGPAHFRTTFD